MTDSDITLIQVDPENLADCGIECISNRKHQGFGLKVDWLEQRFQEGLRFFLFRDARGKALAFLEYLPGEYAWRPVDAQGWLFVHCLWVYAGRQKIGGLGSQLIQACVEEARAQGKRGVAVTVSEGAWMAGKGVFLKNGFEVVGEADRSYSLNSDPSGPPAPPEARS